MSTGTGLVQRQSSDLVIARMNEEAILGFGTGHRREMLQPRSVGRDTTAVDSPDAETPVTVHIGEARYARLERSPRSKTCW